MDMEETPSSARLGKWFAASRKESGLTQEAVATQVGCLIADLSRYENGHKSPTLFRALQICQAVGKELNEMAAAIFGTLGRKSKKAPAEQTPVH